MKFERLNLALWYEEKYGITSCRIDGRNLVYYTSYPTERCTYKVMFDLDNAIESRTVMKRYYKPNTMIGKCRVMYCM